MRRVTHGQGRDVPARDAGALASPLSAAYDRAPTINPIMIKRALLILAATAAPAAAQSNPNMANAAALFRAVSGYITQAANDMSEAQYAFRPTADVRTFGELIGHVAGSQKMFCALALGDKPPAEDAVEKAAKTKAALVAALKESNDYCAKAYALTDASTSAMIDLFGEQRSKMFVLLDNVTHDNEHFGNFVTYMRMNKLVPPSSRPRPSGN
jgi:uncharacterized damage-inducible protein DinB